MKIRIITVLCSLALLALVGCDCKSDVDYAREEFVSAVSNSLLQPDSKWVARNGSVFFDSGSVSVRIDGNGVIYLQQGSSQIAYFTDHGLKHTAFLRFGQNNDLSGFVNGNDQSFLFRYFARCVLPSNSASVSISSFFNTNSLSPVMIEKPESEPKAHLNALEKK